MVTKEEFWKRGLLSVVALGFLVIAVVMFVLIGQDMRSEATFAGAALPVVNSEESPR